ncbi:MAG: YggS family pyridoxal phosphate-dependent enzyme [Anaerolineae bacterium]|nr:YggS family pyridoxal phosphate-dependent enzyme [Anaerolineae bacterium]MBT7070355.1 YggS family pyridoxal phosphate-dependent enzyme [Anaerolineae bacterium]MBT7324397.1 YggS family pyridoxal phosphate-dependent enzyme [Anaerolineae bacterium]
MPVDTLAKSIRIRYQAIQKEVDEAARGAGRNPDSIKLLVVTKKQPLSILRATLAAGVELLGENYPEEAVSKKQALGAENKVEWHMIGHVQSRKARLVAEHFALLHSLDNLKLARRLDRFSAEFGRKLPVLLEFNISGEASKSGWQASDKLNWDHFLPEIGEILTFENLDVQGLMTMPPFFKDAELARPYFRQLRELRDYLSLQYPQVKWEQLSMGTSGDFRVAIEEGATYVRVGQAILGARPI